MNCHECGVTIAAGLFCAEHVLRPCSEPGCDRRGTGSGGYWCRAHSHDRLLWYCEQGPLASECWMPMGQNGLPQDGYGKVRTADGRRIKAHRWMWEQLHGPIPPGRYVCHRCDNPPCCNPEHLYLGGPDTNGHDKAERGRAFRHDERRLTEDQARDARARFAAGRSIGALAAEHGVTTKSMRKLLRGVTYRDVA